MEEISRVVRPLCWTRVTYGVHDIRKIIWIQAT